MRVIWFYICFACLAGCSHRQVFFTLLSPGQTGIDFTNKITETSSFNILNYEYIYNGGGVAIGDVNGDGLPDIYLTANSGPAKLYLNLGHLHFKDITNAAGVGGHPGWKTGVTFCDVNGDGLPDLYVCYSGNGPASARRNQLFINKGLQNGLPVFEDKATEYGVDGGGANSTQAAFLDYDHDGDLDMILIDHAIMFYDPFYNTQKLRTKRHPYFSSKLYRNDSHGDTIRFTDVSEQSGLKGGGNNFNLGVAVSDINGDGWPDIYVTNDYEEQDYLYINQHDGTFRDATRQSLGHTSRYGMGVDVADYNNDGLPDIMVLDMMPADNHRQKLLKGPDDYDKYQQLISNGYYHQNMRNTLQLNVGTKPDGNPVFSEIGQLAGVSNTDWSWAPLFADFDNDGYKDLYVSNGFLHDFTNLDFMRYTVAEEKAQYGQNYPLEDLVTKMPSSQLSNYLFLNNGDLTFRDATAEYGMEKPAIGNGAAYVDLDNDGDLDLVVNSLDGPALVWENHGNELLHHHYLTVLLKGAAPNTGAVGAKLLLEAGGHRQWLENYPTRGYQSSVDYRLHFGLDGDSLIDRLVVYWPLGDSSVLQHIAADQLLTIEQGAVQRATVRPSAIAPLFEDYTAASGIHYLHHEDPYVDFKFQRWLPWQLSRQGPVLCKADVNGDGLEDLYVGGPCGESGVLFLQQKSGQFTPAPTQPWSTDGRHEDAGAAFFDADGDGQPDLYITSGGDELTMTPAERQDRLYLNDGHGHFTPAAADALPPGDGAGSCVRAIDWDHDGKTDLFIGGFALPGYFPLPGKSRLLHNDGKPGHPHFTDLTTAIAPGLQQTGMVTDAVFTDIDKDGWPDLLLAGQWMPIRLFLNDHGRFTDRSSSYGLDQTYGLWTRILPADVDGDGATDFVLGSLAPNTFFHASPQEPLRLFFADFDGNGSPDPLLCFYLHDTLYPYPSRDELVEQIPSLKKRYLHYADYADAKPVDIFGADALQKAKQFHVDELRNSILLNKAGKMHLQPLPTATQLSAVWAIACEDFDGDGHDDLLLAGNFYPFRTQLGREDAGKGLLLKGDGKGGFTPLFYHSTGLLLDGDIRDILPVQTGAGKCYVIACNDDSIRVIKKTGR